ncbi:hypothetical protein IMZ38_02765 [Thermosphaera chiliense]|uniref:Uncharacterized protein n=1 Tax=Thermosphaera chiliense TaxID=3402707 RepID=A0A7M1UT93_9CREN|nr:hypothetical protein [Thermosphaera aggregans]QOR94857.1 hypothetical protein IMZ38_02765 [Thermosphaera aggregans]
MGDTGIMVFEYYFSDYYRVIVFREGENFIVSVDVYRKGWPFKDYEEKCVAEGQVCLLFKTISPAQLPGEPLLSVEKIIVEGVRVSGVEETISVKWFFKGELGQEEVSKVFNASWSLIKCQPPLKDPFNINCEQ